MFTSSWIPWRLARQHKGRSRPRHSPWLRPRSTRLVVEQLEDRTVPSTFTVKNLKDAGVGSLRQAILDANSQPGADLIRFADGLQGTIKLTKGSLSITSELTIQGPGAQAIGIAGGYSKKNGYFRTFEIASGGNASFSEVTISGDGIHNAGTLAISGCAISYNWAGAGILNEGTATVVNSTLSYNSACAIENNGTMTLSGCTLSGNSVSGYGGAIENHGTMTVSGCTLSGNRASGYGGAIDNHGTMTLSGCTLRGNSVAEVWDPYGQYWLSSGGGIANTGRLTVNYCTLSGNSADVTNGGGGGIFNSAGGSVTVANSTLSGNRAGYGAGIKNSGTMTVFNSTLSGNQEGGGVRTDGTLTVVSSTITGNTAGYAGGGICFVDYGGALHMHNTILAGNTGGYSIPDLSGTLTSSGYNLIGNSSGGGGYVGTDLLDVDPRLGPLQDNGGPTYTHALLADSPAIDAGGSALLPPDTLDLDGDGNTTEPIPFDQRGPGFPRVVNGKLDIGAFEVQSVALMAATTGPKAAGTMQTDIPSGTFDGRGIGWLGGIDEVFAEDLFFGKKQRRPRL